MTLKIKREELHRLQEDPLELFYQGIKSNATKDKYTRTLRNILCEALEDVLEGSLENRARQLVKMAKENADWATAVLLTISMKLKERTLLEPRDKDYLHPNSIRNKFKPIKKLFDMNAIPIAWARIYATFPDQNNHGSGRGYTRQEIQKMLNFTRGPLDKAAILIAASSGIRLGAFELKWEDLKPVYKLDGRLSLELTESEVDKSRVVCVILTVYRDSIEEYPAFITPEAYNAILDYRTEWIREVGKEPRPVNPLFKKEGSLVIPLSPNAIKARIDEVLKKAGLRIPLVKGKRRHEVPVMNGFRRFFNKANKETLSKDSPLAALIKKEFQMGHTGLVKLDRNYFQAHILELVEEYLNAVPNLTISDEERAKAENIKLRKEKSELEKTIPTLVEEAVQRMKNELLNKGWKNTDAN